MARAGLCDLDESIVTQRSACAKHRHTYEKFWSPSLQHFKGVLVGATKRQRADTQSNLKWLKPYTQMYGVLIQVGSDAYMYCNFLTHILLHDIGVETFHCFFFKIVYFSLRFLYGRVFRVARRSGRLFSSPVLLSLFMSCWLTALFLPLPDK